jgi:hypothetical protein
MVTMRLILTIALLLCAIQGEAQHHMKRFLVKAAEHVSLGAGVELGVAYAAGGPKKYGAGILAAGLVATFKESADAIAGRDTKKQAALHALTQLAGAGIAAAINHSQREERKVCWDMDAKKCRD